MTERLGRLSTRELRDRLGDGAAQVVDARPIDAWNGWRLRGEPRGGHIPGARALPAKWSGYLDWIEIVRSKGIRPDREVVLYGYDEDEIARVAERFRGAGYERLAAYDGFMAEWSPDEALPLDRLARHEHLVPASWLADRLPAGGGAADGGLVLCHAHYRNRGDYEKGHIPGALPLDTLLLESPETWNRRSPDEVREALLGLGITAGSTVVLYGRYSFPDNRDPFPGSSAGQLAAFRCAFIMLWAGVRDVRVLNGGFQSWTDAGLEVSTEEPQARPASEFGADVPGAPELAADLPEAKEILASPDANLVSVRSWPEYIGEVSGYNYIEKTGRIPGSVFGNCGSDAYHMENYRNLDHTTREYHEIAAAWESAGITPDRRNAFYCGTGWRGSEAFFNAWLMGWPRVAVYDGGWFEWSSDPANPFETGVPPGHAA
ncbi:MAG: rhodanese-like domain-containing protein [Gemmatimonadota bacterium]|nr:rhodanese-like domain-containing protein [Gemmatimonadota bacterium]